MNDNANRIALEKAIVSALIDECGKAGYRPVKFYDSDAYQDASTPEKALEAVFFVDNGTLHFARKDTPKRWGHLGVFLVGGNGEDLISNWHCGDPAFDAAVKATCERIEKAEVSYKV